MIQRSMSKKNTPPMSCPAGAARPTSRAERQEGKGGGRQIAEGMRQVRSFENFTNLARRDRPYLCSGGPVKPRSVRRVPSAELRQAPAFLSPHLGATFRMLVLSDSNSVRL